MRASCRCLFVPSFRSTPSIPRGCVRGAHAESARIRWMPGQRLGMVVGDLERKANMTVESSWLRFPAFELVGQKTAQKQKEWCVLQRQMKTQRN